AADGVYSMARLEPPGDKFDWVKSLNLDTRGVSTPRKNQVKMISSCPLPHADPGPPHCQLHPRPQLPPQPQPELQPDPDRCTPRSRSRRARHGEERKERGPPGPSPLRSPPQIPSTPSPSTLSTERHGRHPDLPSAPCLRKRVPERGRRPRPTYSKVEHIYDEPEGCAAAATTTREEIHPPPLVYDDPEEMRGDAWRIRVQLLTPKVTSIPSTQGWMTMLCPNAPEGVPHHQKKMRRMRRRRRRRREQEEEEEEEDSGYNNVMVKIV
ncbi:hypothetical protein INR49_011560, partial [Caranx melampygus]